MTLGVLAGEQRRRSTKKNKALRSWTSDQIIQFEMGIFRAWNIMESLFCIQSHGKVHGIPKWRCATFNFLKVNWAFRSFLQSYPTGVWSCMLHISLAAEEILVSEWYWKRCGQICGTLWMKVCINPVKVFSFISSWTCLYHRLLGKNSYFDPLKLHQFSHFWWIFNCNFKQSVFVCLSRCTSALTLCGYRLYSLA